MFDDLFDEIDLGGRTGSARAKALFRIFFGLLGVGLAGVGVGLILFSDRFASAGLPLRTAMALLFGFLGAFCAINIALHKPSRWPGLGFLATLPLLFAVRIIFGP